MDPAAFGSCGWQGRGIAHRAANVAIDCFYSFTASQRHSSCPAPGAGNREKPHVSGAVFAAT